MAKYLLHYFGIGSRAGAIRLIFKLAGVDFEDRRIPLAEWPQYKEKFPMQQMPVLEVDGVFIAQSMAILRYLAREFGYYGSTSLEGAFIDEVMDAAYDAWMPVPSIFNSAIGQERDKLVKNFKEEHLPRVYGRLDALLALDRAGDFFVGNSITAADLFFFAMADTMDIYVQCNSLEKFPQLAALKSRVAANPAIAKWLAERPQPEINLDLRKVKF